MARCLYIQRSMEQCSWHRLAHRNKDKSTQSNKALAVNSMRAFVYIWTHTSAKFYIGGHIGTEDDGYICSSNIILDSIRAEPDQWQRHILATGTAAEMRLVEQQTIEQYLAEPGCLNQTQGDGFKIVFKDKLEVGKTTMTAEATHILNLLGEKIGRQ